jgi:LuxR family maltose regulon positive regulatory protein
MESDFPVMLTKLKPPHLNDDLVTRLNLIDRLDTRINRIMALVSAPSRFGKPTLVADWLRSVNQPTSWYPLDQNDNNLLIFLR